MGQLSSATKRLSECSRSILVGQFLVLVSASFTNIACVLTMGVHCLKPKKGNKSKPRRMPKSKRPSVPGAACSFRMSPAPMYGPLALMFLGFLCGRVGGSIQIMFHFIKWYLAKPSSATLRMNGSLVHAPTAQVDPAMQWWIAMRGACCAAASFQLYDATFSGH